MGRTWGFWGPMVKSSRPSSKNPFLPRYIQADISSKPRLIGLSTGEVGSGKSSFWLGAPGPIVVQTLDQGLEGVVEKYAGDKEIYIAEYDLGQSGETFSHKMAVEAADKFEDDFAHAMQHARTIIWDRESDMFPLFTYAESGTKDAFGAVAAKDWDLIKGRIRRMIAMAKAGDVNLGIIQGMKNEWVQKVNPRTGNSTGQPSGARIPSGMNDIDALVHITLEHIREDGEFTIKVGKARGPGGSAVQDQTYPAMSFVDFAMLVFPDSTEDQWL